MVLKPGAIIPVARNGGPQGESLRPLQRSGDPQLSQIVFSTGPFVFKMRKNLQDFRAQDYILCTGDPAVIGLSTAIVSDITTGKFNLLKWDKREFKYYPLSIDLYKKG